MARTVALKHVEEGGVNLQDVEFVEQAALRTVECRNILKWTYAYGFFATWNNSDPTRALFEYHQAQLERTLDSLQEKVEKVVKMELSSWNEETLSEMKYDLVNRTTVIGVFFENICKALQ